MKGRNRNGPCWCGSGEKYKKCHLHSDNQKKELPPGKRKDPTGSHFEIVRLNITLKDVYPKVTRRMEVRTNTLLDNLNRYIQAAMGWEELHWWMFEALRYGKFTQWCPESGSDSPILDSNDTIFDVINFLDGKPEFKYIYDFGDTWIHRIRIGSKIKPANEDRHYPYLVSGSGRCPPEDIGGSWGYEDFLDAFEDPSSSLREVIPGYFDGTTTWDPEDAGLDERRAKLASLGASG